MYTWYVWAFSLMQLRRYESCEIKWFPNLKMRLSEDEPMPTHKDPFQSLGRTHSRRDIISGIGSFFRDFHRALNKWPKEEPLRGSEGHLRAV